MDNPSRENVLALTAQIVSAHVSNNLVPPDALPALIGEVFRTLAGIGKQPEPAGRPNPTIAVKNRPVRLIRSSLKKKAN